MKATDSLEKWLSYLEQLHPKTIDLGLERFKTVLQRLNIQDSALKIVVAGTNGKGSTCALLDAIYRASGYQVGVYTSPHLLRFNERIVVQGRMVDDSTIVQAFSQIEAKRGDVSLTYFEYTTLAAFLIFQQAKLDVWVLEVGLGGRLDAVNAIDSDCAILTSVDLDHAAYLGNTREEVGFEKAHVFRPQGLSVCVEPNPPDTVLDYAHHIHTHLLRFGEDFEYIKQDVDWIFKMGGKEWVCPYPFMKGEHQLLNASGVLAVIMGMSDRYPVTQEAVQEGLKRTRVVGRVQEVCTAPQVILDVSHNPHAVRALAHYLSSHPSRGKTYAVVGVLKDKNLEEIIQWILPYIDEWFCVTLKGERGRLATSIQTQVKQQDPQAHTQCFDSPVLGYQQAFSSMQEEDRCLVFGSFLTVCEVQQWIEHEGLD